METMDEFHEDEKLMNDKDNKIENKNRSKKYLIIIIILVILLIISLITVIIIVSALKNTNNDNSSKKQDSSPIYIKPSSGVHTHTIIFLPGLTNTPEDFLKVLTSYVTFNKRNTTKIVILRSQLQEVTVLNGTKNYSWFDIYYFPLNSSNSYNVEELKISSNILKNYIEEEAKKLNNNYEKIIIGGHSQGAMLSLFTGYTFKYKLGGVISWSGVLPPIKKEDILPEKEKLNVFYSYGLLDNIIIPEYFSKSINDIKDFDGFNISIYPNQTHSVGRNEI